MHPYLKEQKKARAHALAYVPAPAFRTKPERTSFEIEEAKQNILSDFHRLSDIVGKSSARAFIFDEIIDPLPKSYERA